MNKINLTAKSINTLLESVNEDDSNSLGWFRSYMKSGWAFTPSTVISYSSGSTTLGKLFSYLKSAPSDVTQKFMKDFSNFSSSIDDSRPGGTAVLRFLSSYVEKNNIK